MAPSSTLDPHAIRTMDMGDYDAVLALMKQTPGVSVRDADSRESTERYLLRNPGLSFVATSGQRLVGMIMSGHDGRRGYLQHLVVLPEFRRMGIASELVERCLAALTELGIHKSHIEVYRTNESAQAYWEAGGWTRRTDTYRYSIVRGGGDNA